MGLFGNLPFLAGIVCLVSAGYAFMEEHERDLILWLILAGFNFATAYFYRDRARRMLRRLR